MIYNNLPRSSRWAVSGPTRQRSRAPNTRSYFVRLAFEIDLTVRERAPAGWKGDEAREAQVLNALFPLLDRDRVATLALFELIKNQPGY